MRNRQTPFSNVTKALYGSILLAALLMPVGHTARAAEEAPNRGPGKILDRTIGPWKASCFIDQSGPDPYCRIMAVHIFNRSQRSGDFAQFGTAFDRGSKGFIVATYYGFSRESHVTVGIDGNQPINMPAPMQGNHIMAPPSIAEVLLKQMLDGKTLKVTFKTNLRGHVDLRYPLDGFRDLHAAVQKALKTK